MDNDNVTLSTSEKDTYIINILYFQTIVIEGLGLRLCVFEDKRKE